MDAIPLLVAVGLVMQVSAVPQFHKCSVPTVVFPCRTRPFPSDDPLPPSGGGSAGVPSAGFISGGADNRQAMLERQRQLAAQRNRDRMTGGITMTDAPANSTTAMPLSGRSATRFQRSSRVQCPRGGDTVFDDNPRQSRRQERAGV